jgi:nitroimidazol reductase NimA-like FMN-containing flavoprotein (pyridoxamine 5'-phosphate oxidase superfamily)
MTDTVRDSSAPTVHILSPDECLARLSTANVGRVGFVTGQGLQILPLNYRATADAITLSTTPNGSLSQLAEMGAAVTLEADEHDSATGLVWSVMVQGTVSKIPRATTRQPVTADLVDSWPGDQFSEALRFTPRSYSGRLLEHPVAAAATAP